VGGVGDGCLVSRILIIAPAWVGDMVMAQSLVAALQAREPGADVDLVAPPLTAALGARMPGVAETHVIGTAHGRFDLAGRRRFGRALRGEGYDLAIVLPGSFKSALVPFFARIPRRRGYVGEMRYGVLNDLRRLDKEKVVRTVDRFVGLAAGPGEATPAAPPPALRADPENARGAAMTLGLAGDGRRVIALCPGAEFGPAKQWPAKHFASLARLLGERGFAIWLLGSPKDKAIAEEICALASREGRGAPVDLTGRTSLIEAVDLLSLASAVVANDSGLMHVAAALGRPVVALYGSTPSTVAPPLSDNARIVERTLSCRPCFERVCPLGHLDCLNLIEAGEVAAMLDELIGRVEAEAVPPA
jgi:heptosyltransferase-2